MNNPPSRVIGLLASTMGISILLGIALSLFKMDRSQLLATSDFMIVLGALLNMVLAWMVYRNLSAGSSRFGRLSLMTAMMGSLIVSIGSALDFSSAVLGYGFFSLFPLSQTRSIMVLGYGFIGLWLLLLNDHARAHGTWSRQLAWSGILAGAMMAIGLLAAPRIFLPYVSLYHEPVPEIGEWLGDLGWMLFYPIWSIWLGRVFLRGQYDGQHRQSFLPRFQ